MLWQTRELVENDFSRQKKFARAATLSFHIMMRCELGIQGWSFMMVTAVRGGFLALGLALIASIGAFAIGFDPEEIWHFYGLGKLAGISIIVASIALAIARQAPRAFLPLTGLGLIALSIWNIVIGLDHNGTHRHALHQNAGLGLSDLIHAYEINNASTVIGGSLAPDLDVQQIMVFEDGPLEMVSGSFVVSLASYLEAGIASWTRNGVGKAAIRATDGGYRRVDLGAGLVGYISSALIETPLASVDLCIILRARSLVLTERGCPPSTTENNEDRS